MDQLKQLSQGQQIFAGGAVVFVIAYFLPWFSADAGPFTVTASGGDLGALWATIPMLLAIAMTAVIVVRALKPEAGLPDWPWAQITLGVGGFAAAMVLLKLIIGEDDGGGIIQISRGTGIFLALLAGIAMAAGGWLEFQSSQKEA